MAASLNPARGARASFSHNPKRKAVRGDVHLPSWNSGGEEGGETLPQRVRNAGSQAPSTPSLLLVTVLCPSAGTRLHHQLPEEGDALGVRKGKQEEAADPQAACHLRKDPARASHLPWRLS